MTVTEIKEAASDITNAEVQIPQYDAPNRKLVNILRNKIKSEHL